mmetsp:Transcript_26837/g.79318  ORF Transcript_26837/g.79318 Transcript_26837/m.79318 type:complete len:1011 (-) Transcript_26837:65-3097(-)
MNNLDSIRGSSAKRVGETRRRKDGSCGVGKHSSVRSSDESALPLSYSPSRFSSSSESSWQTTSSKERKRTYAHRLSLAANLGRSLGASATRASFDAATRLRSAIVQSSMLRTAGQRLTQSLSISRVLLIMCVPVIYSLSANIREQNRRMADMEAEQCRTNGRLCMSRESLVTGRMCTAQEQLPFPWTGKTQYKKQGQESERYGGSKGNTSTALSKVREGWAGSNHVSTWEKKPLVCIVVTTYNVDRYIERTLDSILQQTYDNFEVLVVDDASTDRTQDKIEHYTKADPRFKKIVLHQSTLGGAGQPTNIGMDACSEEAEFILIVDGDDWIERDALESVVSNALMYRSDVVVADFDTFEQIDSSTILQDGYGDRSNVADLSGYHGGNGTHTYTVTVDLFNKTSIELFFDHGSEGSGSQVAPFAFSPSYDHRHWDKIPPNVHFNVLTNPRILRVSPVPWRKLYRRDFIEAFDLRFPEADVFYEDNTFHWLVLGHAALISKVDRVLFHHRRNRKGQTSASYSKRDFVGRAEGRSNVAVELRPGEDNASTDSDDTAPNSKLDPKEEDHYWQDYYKSSRMGGYLPNIHNIGMAIFSGFHYRSRSPCEKVAVGDVAKMYFNWIRSSVWIAKLQKSSQMTEKFQRLLQRTERYWHGELLAGGFDVDVGVSEPLLSWFPSEEKIDLSLVLPTKDVVDLLPALLMDMYDGLTRSRLKFEVFAVDDGSTDGTIRVLRDFANAHSSNFYLLESGQEKPGAGRARNTAIPLIEGEYVYFADADDTFDFAALAGAVRYASKHDVDLAVLPYRTEYVKPGLSTVDDMLPNDLKIWNVMRSKLRSWFYPFSDDERKMAAFRLINYPWKQLTSASLLRNAGVFFGPTVVQNDVQFHWTSIAAARNIQFYNRVVCTHRKFDSAVRGQLTEVRSHRLGMLDAVGMAQRAMARQGAFDGTVGKDVLEQWTKFFTSLSQWAKYRVPKESLPTFATRRDYFLRALEELEPYSLGKWAYWRHEESDTSKAKR